VVKKVGKKKEERVNADHSRPQGKKKTEYRPQLEKQNSDNPLIGEKGKTAKKADGTKWGGTTAGAARRILLLGEGS